MSAETANLSRREFARKASVALGTSAVVSHHWASDILTPQNAARGNEVVAKEPDGTYLDFHVHLTQRWFGKGRGPLTARHLLHWMDDHDIAQAVVLPLVSPESFWYPVTTEYVLSETATHRDRLIPFCAIDPRALATHLTDQRHVVEMLSRYQEAGARGFRRA